MTGKAFRERIYDLEFKYGREAFYQLPNNHPDIKEVRRLGNGGKERDLTAKQRFEDTRYKNVRQLAKTMTTHELAEHFGVTYPTMYTRLQSMGVVAVPKIRRNDKTGRSYNQPIAMKNLNHETVRWFDNANDVESKTGILSAGVRKACREQKPYKKHYWEYI